MTNKDIKTKVGDTVGSEASTGHAVQCGFRVMWHRWEGYLQEMQLLYGQGRRCLSNLPVQERFCSGMADMTELLTSRGVPWREVDDLREVAADVDVLYMTRIQKERFKDMQVRQQGSEDRQPLLYLQPAFILAQLCNRCRCSDAKMKVNQGFPVNPFRIT
eukprot:scaffold259814_cov22-Tisochrysis_lutea.AAC.1